MITDSARALVLKGVERRRWENSVIGDSRLNKSTDVFLMTVILGYCRGKSECWPTVKTLAKQMKLTDRSVQAAIKRCVKVEVIRLDKDSGLASRRKFVVLSHPSLNQDGHEDDDRNKSEKPAVTRCKNCASHPKILRTKAEYKTEYSSSSSLRSEESSSKPEPKPERVTTTDLPQALIQEISRSLPERDAKAILGAGRLIARKALGKWDLISKAIAYIKRQRDSIKGVVPYLVSIVDSWANEGIPNHILNMLVPQSTPDETRRVVWASPEKRQWYKEYHDKLRAKHAASLGLA